MIQYLFFYIFLYLSISFLFENNISPFLGGLALVSLLAYYVIDYKKKNDYNFRTIIYLVFSYYYLIILYLNNYEGILSIIILISLLTFHVIEEIRFCRIQNTYIKYLLKYYSLYLFILLLFMTFKEHFPIINIFNNNTFSSISNNIFFSLLVYLSIPHFFKYLIYKYFHN